MEDRDIVERLKALDDDDHERLTCSARYAECSCGYLERLQTVVPEVAAEITRLRGEVERLTAERDGWVLVPKVPTPAMLEQTAFNLCDEYGVAFVRPLSKFVQDAYTELLSSAPKPGEG